MEDGRHEIDGNNAYVNVFTTVLHKRTADRYEVHKLYADIQIPLNGTDMIAVCPLDETGEREEYNEAGDTFFVNGGEPSIVNVRPGTMLILMPQDAHDPGLTKTEAGKKIRKAVIKVRV